MGKSTRKKQLAERINSLRKQYDEFLEEDKKRKERNNYILGRMDNMRAATAALRLRYNTLKPIEAPQSKQDSASDNFLQVTPLRNSTLTQLNGETDENKVLNEINKRFILIPRNSSLLNQNFTHSKEKVDDVDWTSKYNILDQLKKSELEIDVTKENQLEKNTKGNKIRNKKISFEDSTDDEKDIDTSLSENIYERENYETGANATNYDNQRIQHNQIKNTAQNEFDQNEPINPILNISPKKIVKPQVEENKQNQIQNLIQTEANILADGIIKSLEKRNTEKFDPGIQNGQHVLENKSNDIHYKNDSPILKHNAHNTQPETQDEVANKYNDPTTNSLIPNDTQDGYQQPSIIQDTSNKHSEILDRNYVKQNEEEIREGMQNPDYEGQNIIADHYNEQNVKQPDEYKTEHPNQNYEEENIVTDNNHYDGNTVQQAEVYPTDQLNQNYEEQNIVTENNDYDQNNQQSDQYEHHLAEEPNQNYGDNIVSENNYYDENNQQSVDQYEQLSEQQNQNYKEQQNVAENNYYDENNQQQVDQYEQLGEQQNPNYEEQPIVADDNYYNDNNQQQSDLHQQYSDEQPTTNYDEQNIVPENVYYDENGQQQSNQYDQLAQQPISNYDEQPVAVENNYYDENNQQYPTEQPNDNYNEQYDENYQQEQLYNDQGPPEVRQNLNEETAVLFNEQLTQG